MRHLPLTLFVCLAFAACGDNEQSSFGSSRSALGPAARTSWTAAGATQPGSGTAGVTLPTMRVAITDTANAVVPSSTLTVTLSVMGNAAPISGTTSRAAVGGVATFDDIVIPKTGSFKLIAQAPGMTSSTSATFTVAPGPADHLEFTVQPTTVNAGTVFSPAVQVSVLDATGNPVNTPQTIAVAIQDNPGGSTLTGTATVNTSTGRANFTSIKLNKPGIAYTLVATAGALPALASAAFDVTRGPATKLVVVSGGGQSVNVGAAAPFPLVAEAQDAAGNVVPMVAVDWVAVTGGGSISPPSSTTDAAGRTQASVTMGTTSGAQRYEARGAGLTAAVFNLTGRALAASQLVNLSGDAQTQTAGEPLAAPLVVRVTDAYGNPVANQTLTWTVTSGGGSLSAATSRSDATGAASISATLGAVAGSNTFRAAKAGLNSIDFSATGVPGAPGFVTFPAQPQTAQVTAVLSPVIVRVTDLRGNAIDGVAVTLALSGGATLSGTSSALTAAGEATFADLAVDTIGTYQLVASAGMVQGTSAPFAITCAQGLVACGTQCVDLNGDTANCGACGHACGGPNATAFVCNAGVCAVSVCQPGRGDCDVDVANGCETVLETNANHCGACGRACASGIACRQGMCGVDDAASEFKTSSNPAATWQYGKKVAGTFVRFPVTQTDDYGGNPLERWTDGTSDATVFHNAGTGAISLLGGTLVAGGLAILPGSSEPVVLRYTAPATGTYRLYLDFEGLVHGSQTFTFTEARSPHVVSCRQRLGFFCGNFDGVRYHDDWANSFCCEGARYLPGADVQSTSRTVPLQSTPSFGVEVNGTAAWGQTGFDTDGNGTCFQFGWDESWHYAEPRRSHCYSYGTTRESSHHGATVLSLQAGDFVDVVVGAGSYGNSGDFTRVQARLEPTCPVGFRDCDGDPSNGCETELTTVDGTCDSDSVSRTTAGLEMQGDLPAISDDGRFVVTRSFTANAEIGASIGALYVRDRVARTTRLLSRALQGEPDNQSDSPVMTSDGRWVAFRSYATNLVSGDTNARGDIFVADRSTGAIERISTDSAGAEANGESWEPSISQDGRWVAFTSYATNLVPGDSNGVHDVFVKDRASGAIFRVGGVEPNQFSFTPRLSADGMTIAFSSYATNLVPDDTNGRYDVFVATPPSAAPRRVSLTNAGTQSPGYAQTLAISGDGHTVAFMGLLGDFGCGGPLNQWQSYVVDLRTGELSCQLAAVSGQAVGLSSNGRFVTFQTTAGLDAADTDGRTDAYVLDRLTGATSLLSRDTNGLGSFTQAWSAEVSSNGRFAAVSASGKSLTTDATGGGVFVYPVFRPAESLIVQSPATTAAGDVVTIRARLYDERGRVAALSGLPVTLSITSGPSGATIIGAATVNASAGVATFNVALDKAGDYRLHASAAGFTPRDSDKITVVGGAPAQLLVVAGDAQVGVAGSVLAPLTVRLTDAYGNPLGGRTIDWLVAQGAGSVSEVAGITDANGEVSTTPTLDTHAGPNAFTANFGALSAAFSAVGVAGEPAALVWVVQPSSAVAGVLFSPAPVVALVDAYGNPADQISASVHWRWSVEDFDFSGRFISLLGDTTVALSGGYATFSNVYAHVANTDTTLAASGLFSVVSDPVSVSAGPVSAAASSITATPATAEANGVDFVGFLIQPRDQFGNPLSGVVATLDVSGTGALLTQPTGLTGGRLASTHAGLKEVACTVNGVLFAAPAQVTFTPLSSCPATSGDCNGDSTDGCETDLTSSLSSCGACGAACAFANAAASCMASACQLGSCNSGFADCDGNATNGCETAGTCAPSCGGAPPAATPEVLASGRNQPLRIVADGTSFYWTEYGGGALYKCSSATGCSGSPTQLATGSSPWGIAVSGSNLFWSDSTANDVYTCGTACTNNGVAQFGSGTGGAAALAANGTHFFWNDADQAIYSCPAGGCSGAPNVLVTGAYNPIYLALDSSSLFFMNGQLLKCPLGGCVGNTPEVLSTDGVSKFGGIATDGTKVYYSTFSGGEIHSCDVGGCAAGDLVASTPGGLPVAMAVDACNVFWADQATNTIYACPKSGCGSSPWTLATAQENPTGLAVDDGYIYWVNKGAGSNDGSVMRLPKW